MTFQENLVPKFRGKGEQGQDHAPLPHRKVHLWHIFFALPAMNGPLPAELKFRRTLNIKILLFLFITVMKSR